MAQQTRTGLYEYIESDQAFYLAYEVYEPDVTMLKEVHRVQPAAHVITPSRYTCSDCVRNLPRMARIAEHLPGWTWEVFPSSDEERRQSLNITRIPTFIVYDAEGGQELGRIVENPATGSLEQDLLNIVS